MILTFAIEALLTLYVYFKYKLKAKLAHLAVATLVLLTTFQFVEYFVCTGARHALLFSRVGYAAITLLPPVGLHLILTCAGKKKPSLLAFSYILASLFIVFFVFAPQSINAAACGKNYVVFRLHPNINILYGVYYNALLVLSILLALYYKKTIASARIRGALMWIIFGYLTFYIPTGIIYLINPHISSGVPSIMCGFALLYAFILVFKVLPASSGKPKN